MSPFFIVGAPRSGTTLLRNILRSHPGLECPEETCFYRWEAPFGTKRFKNLYQGDDNLFRHRQIDGFAEDEFWEIFENSRSRREFQDRYMERYLEIQDNPDATWFDKSPQNVFGLFRLIADYPNSPIIHIHRNPLNVVASIRMGRSMGPEPVIGAANIWLESVSTAIQAQQLMPGQIKAVAFEDFAGQHDQIIDDLLEFVGLHPQKLQFSFQIDPPPERFVDVLSEDEIETVLEICGPAMETLGYPTSARENFERTHTPEPGTTIRRKLARLRRRMTGANRQPDKLFEPPPDRLLPTMSLYLFEALRSERMEFQEPLESLGPHLFRCGDTLICVRYATNEEIDQIEACGNGSSATSLIYLVDDFLEAIPEDQNLPDDYRKKIGEFIDNRFSRILERADSLVVSSPFLAEHYRSTTGKPVHLLSPFWPVEWAPLDHQIRDRQDPFSINWTATRSHLTDLESIRPAIETFLKNHPNASLTVRCGDHLPGWLETLPRVNNLKPLSWTEYRQQIETQQTHAALYPVLDTPVNRARSTNKIMEHAMLGAVSLFSENVPFSGQLESDTDAFLIPGNPEAWLEKLEFLIAHPDASREIAVAGLRKAVYLARRAKQEQIQFWQKRLPLQLDPLIATGRACS